MKKNMDQWPLPVPSMNESEQYEAQRDSIGGMTGRRQNFPYTYSDF